MSLRVFSLYDKVGKCKLCGAGMGMKEAPRQRHLDRHLAKLRESRLLDRDVTDSARMRVARAERKDL